LQTTRVLSGQGDGKTMRHVMLDSWSNWIVAFGYEEVGGGHGGWVVVVTNNCGG